LQKKKNNNNATKTFFLALGLCMSGAKSFFVKQHIHFLCFLLFSCAKKKKLTDKPTVLLRFEPSSTIIENDHVNVTLHCDVLDGNPRKLLKVQWMINDDILTELPECNGTKITLL
jgi:hypothetical protein